MGTGMTTDRLFGGFDLKTFNESGRMEYLVENSFMNHEYVIFEELFDAPDFILEQLKDILSAKVFRNGSQVFPLKTRIILCATNKTRDEFAKNNSLKALMERFPLEHNVKWNTHNREDYELLLTTKLGFADPLLTYILASYHASGHTISPRIALSAAEILEACGIDCLQFIADFSTPPELLQNCLAKFEAVIKLDKMTAEAHQLITTVNAIHHFDPTTGRASDIGKFKKAIRALKDLTSNIENLTVDDNQINAKTEIIKSANRCASDANAILEILV
jgi:MoxR-like ATPase